MRRSTLTIAILAAAASFVLAPHPSSSQATAGVTAARELLAASYLDARLNPAKGEDTEFFIRAGGIPNIFFLMDSSGAMSRLPPDGPASYGGAGAAIPPGVLLTDPSSATAAAAAARTVGCGIDATSAAAFGQNPTFQALNRRAFYPPCGKAHDQTLVGAAYAGDPSIAAGKDYAYQASACPYYTSANNQTYDSTKGGYDPEFYNPSPNNSQIPDVFFVKGLVYHDNVHDAGADGETNRNWARTALGLGHNFGNGWSARASPAQAYPYKTSGGYATLQEFCDEQGTTALANGQVPSTVCMECLQQKGWYYDGFTLERPIDGASKQYPSLWYTGNYLNFFPPKFIAARKIVKDVVATQAKVRMALASFGTDGYKFRQDFNPTCDHPNSSFDQNRGTYIGAVNAITFDGRAPLSRALFDVGRFYHSPGLEWFGSTWEKSNTGSGSETWESSANSNALAICYSCQTSSVIVLTGATPECGDGGSSTTPACPTAYAGTTLPTSSSPTTAALADGDHYAGDALTGVRNVSTTDCPSCGAFTDAADDYKNNLSRVSWYMHTFDLRDNTEDTEDCLHNGGRQTIDVYTVGYATSTQPDASAILAGAASAGGGQFIAAEDPSSLRAGILSVLEEISERSTSFSVATVSTLQTTTGHTVIVPRFDPEKSPFWKGHLYSYDLYSEFVNACDPSLPATSGSPPCCKAGTAGDLDCDGKCESVFLQDRGGKFIQEGGDGFFYRNDPVTQAACSQAPSCGTSCASTGTARAQPWWDAAEGLAATSWKARKVFTVVDRNDDGRIDRTDATSPYGPVLLDSSTTDAAEKILPYLGLGGGQVCNRVADRIQTAGDAVTATVVRTTPLECGRTIIRWILGADVFNAAGRKATDSPSWPPARPFPALPATVGDASAVPAVAANLPNQELLADRPLKLGDVFHSSPVVVDPPLPLDGILCPNGLHNQCLTALWQTPTEDGADAAYKDYQTSAYKTRRKVILVGSNDGLLHAFNGGKWHDLDNDPYTPAIDESKWPFFGYYDRGGAETLASSERANPPPSSSEIWAEELWAFLPPDLLPKLGLSLAGEHQLMTDGTAMVRDAWVDGTSNGLDTAATADDAKQKQEFHTVAVVGERRGGTRYFALDVTNATKLRRETGFALPTFLWIYPQPTDAESLQFGETYDDFLPSPAPIGPVRIEANARAGTVLGVPSSPVAATQTMFVEGPGNVPYHERWIAFLSGGFDPNYLRGRGVHMVDVWTGKELWDFSYPRTAVAATDPRLGLKYPVAAPVGMVMWGGSERREAGLGFANQGFFDTATFGDTGGQLWTLRFHVPGQLGSDDKVGNWYGARAFQMGDSGDPSFGYQHPFFYLTTNTALPGSYIFRTYLGTGDRFNLLDTNGGNCGPDNVRACLMRGCSVSLPLDSNYLATPSLGRQKDSLSAAARGTATYGAASETGVTQVEGQVRIEISGCPGAASGAPTGTTKSAPFACTADSAGRWGCSSTATPDLGQKLELSNTSNTVAVRNWFFSIRIFDDEGARRPFTTPEQAAAYDGARLWLKDPGASGTVTQSGSIVVIDSAVENPAATTLATESSPGWAIYYNHGPSAVVGDVTYTVSKLDERTSSVSSLYRVLTWNTTQPSLSTAATTNGGSCFVSKCVAEDRRVAYHYAAHPLTGGSVLRDASGNVIRARVSNTLVPAQGDQATVFVNAKGQALVSQTVVNPEKGAGSIAAGAAMDAVMDLGWVEIPESTHECRHSATPPAAGVCR